MVSIIISSKQLHITEALSKNIKATIGVPYEILVMENSDARYGICEAYNKGAAQSQYPILCFLHEDILIQTQNWGAILLQHFNQSNYGVIGIAGSIYKSAIPCSWDGAGKLANRINILQLDANNKSYKDYYNPTNETISHVVTLDGVFISCKKVIFNTILFNDNLLKGFHGYDIDFSLRANKITRLGVVYNIDVLHYSKGNFNEAWLQAQIALHSKIFINNKQAVFVEAKGLDSNNNSSFEKNSYKGTCRSICNNINISMQTVHKWLQVTNPNNLKYPFFTLKYLLKARRLRRIKK